jgi:diguanylate cyclase (GGDEF)-like protein
MTLDIRPFWLIGALASSGFGVLVLVVRKAYPANLGRVLSLWGAASLCLGVNYALRLGPPREGQFVFNVLSNTLIAACLTLEFWAIRVLKRQTTSLQWIIGPPLLMFAVSIWFTFIQRNISIENMIFDSINVSMMLLIARALLRTEEGRRPFADVALSVIYVLLAVAISGVIANFFIDRQFSPEYNFSNPRAIFNNIAAILAEGVVFPLFLLMLSERLNRNLVAQAMRDPLTDLFNRRAFEEIAFREMSGAARTGMGLSLLMFDIDRFKDVNDRFGHAAGDSVLNAVAATLRGCLRDEDFLCRWGGDEFFALLPRARREQAQFVAERVLQSFEDFDFKLDEKPVKIAVSIGIVTNERSAQDVASLVDQADVALYRAKAAGRGRFAFAPDSHSPEGNPQPESPDCPSEA